MEQNKAKKHEGDPGKAVMKLDRDFQIGEIDKRIYGSFIEHIAERFTEAFMIRPSSCRRLRIPQGCH